MLGGGHWNCYSRCLTNLASVGMKRLDLRATSPKPSGFTPGTEVLVSPAKINDAGIVVGYSHGTIAGVEAIRATVWRPVGR